MGKIKSFLLSFWVIGLMAGCDASLERLELHETTELLKEPGVQNLGFPEKQVAILPSGTKVVVLDKRYGKDYLAYKVETDDGLKGYIIHSSRMTLTTHQ
ncbi:MULTISPECIES: SH3 domain-containing protein [Pseudoalteromonas]|uniref:SH3 domain-containing protein n=1 Tax=Pseudoalteromonas TaxID=53246 RepID=UPI00026D1EAE|nr:MULTISPECIES: SH3 domain-containing protein [Pseudoalteromonas]MBH0003709.1 SH3 domain-containing protein [Pseudoalteromonas sp. SWYJZ12]